MSLTVKERRQVQAIGEAAGCTGFVLVRDHKHVVVDYTHPDVPAPVRLTIAKTASDHRAFKNQIRDLTNAIRVRRERLQ